MITIEDNMLHYDSCGLSNVWLKGGYEVTETPYGRGVSIHDVEGLHRVIGLHIAKDKPSLSGEEFRFLRIELDMPQTTVASFLGVAESTVRNWENNRTDITSSAERLLRTIYIGTFGEGDDGNCHIKELIEHMSQLNRDAHWERVELEQHGNSWSAQVA